MINGFICADGPLSTHSLTKQTSFYFQGRYGQTYFGLGFGLESMGLGCGLYGLRLGFG